MDQISSPDYEFEGFRLDTSLQVLFSPAGEHLPLPSRTFETLRFLVERAGELVEKSTLMQAVWPRTVVEENNLNQCILALRRVLGESAGERRFILTVPGRGFKFVAPVTVLPRVRGGQEPKLAVPPNPRFRLSWFAFAGALTVAVLVGLLYAQHRRSPVTLPAEYQALTNFTDSATSPVLSTDGRMLAFIRGPDPFLASGQVWLKLLPDGEPVQLTHATNPIFAPTFTADGTHIAYTTMDSDLSRAWDTWVIPITGGEATKLLPNASGLTFTGPHEVMYSEFKAGIHLGIVASRDDRSAHREVYLPSHERGMAHYSYLSPDRRSVLVVEMDRTATFQRCRLLPFDGSSAGHAVGPLGSCISAAWSPDGRWMYFSVQIGARSHLWRQRYPDGAPEQITFGPTDEQTVTSSPDGRSLLTALGSTQSSIWMHAGGNDRVLISERDAHTPWLSADARRVYFLTTANTRDPSELWRVNVDTGHEESVLSGYAINSYDVSLDEQQVVFTTGNEGNSQIWIAPMDRHAPPRELIRGGDSVKFDAAGDIFFRSLGEKANYLHRMHADGGANVRVFDKPIEEFHSVAPDGKHVAVDLPVAGDMGAAWLLNIDSGGARMVRRGWWPSSWSKDGRQWFLEIGVDPQSARHGRTAVLKVGADGFPDTSAPFSRSETEQIPHAELALSVAADPSVYVFERGETRRNIYRIPLH